MEYVGFVGPSYTTAARTASVERLVNWYLETQESRGSKVPAALIPTPGVKALVPDTGSLGAGRGIWALNDRCLAALGNGIYEVRHDRSRPAGERWSISPPLQPIAGTGPVQFASTGLGSREVLAVAGGRGYLFDTSGTSISLKASPQLAALVDDNAGTKLTHCAFMNSRFVVFDSTRSRFWISQPNNGTAWDQLDVSSRSQAGDNLVALAVLDNDLWLFGEETTEIWYDSGAADQPFVPRPGAFFQYGCLAPYSVAELDGTWCWLGREQEGEGTVWRTTRGYSDPERISTHSVERAIADYARPEDAVGWAYKRHGHSFYVLSFTGTPGGTWVYDARSGTWHEWLTYQEAAELYIPLRVQYHARFRDESLVLDRQGGTIYALDYESSVDAGGALVRRVRRAPVLSYEEQQISFFKLKFDLEVGTAELPPAEGQDPKMIVRWNNDNGVGRWVEREVPLGKRGEYNTQPIARRMGIGRNRVYEVWITAPVPISIAGAYLHLRPGAH